MALKDGLIAVWCEAVDPAEDLHVNLLDLTHTSGTVGAAAGKVGTAGDFEADDTEHLALADEAGVSFADEAASGSLWARPESVADFIRVFGKGAFNSPADGEYLIQHTDNGGAKQFRLVVSDGSSFASVFATTFGATNIGEWYCVQWYHDPVANEIGIRVNGSAWDTASHAGGLLDGSDPLYVGGYSGGANFDGLINQVALWRAVKSDGDLDAIYAGGDGLPFGDWDAGGGGLAAFDWWVLGEPPRAAGVHAVAY